MPSAMACIRRRVMPRLRRACWKKAQTSYAATMPKYATAAPITAYVLGFAAGAGDLNPEQVERLAAKAQQLAENWDRPADAPDPDDIDDDVPDDSTVDHSTDRYED